MNKWQNYFVDSTLLDSQLIDLKKYYINPIPEMLKARQNIQIKLFLNKNDNYVFSECHIDPHRRLRIPNELLCWIRNTYSFSVAYFSSNTGKTKVGVWKKCDVKRFYDAVNKVTDKKTGNPVKMDIPGETMLIAWDDANHCLLIRQGFLIDETNATEYLSDKAIASVLPYILNTVKNTSMRVPASNGKKCYIIDQTTNWQDVATYSKTEFSHPGIYLLRRLVEDGGYAYYVGKAVDINNRIKKNDNKVSHPDEKYEDNKQYDEIACISIIFDDFIRLYGALTENNKTLTNNPGVSRGSDTDNALYAVEDIAIHVAAMILLSEGKKLDNKQYRSYTSQWIDGIS